MNGIMCNGSSIKQNEFHSIVQFSNVGAFEGYPTYYQRNRIVLFATVWYSFKNLEMALTEFTYSLLVFEILDRLSYLSTYRRSWKLFLYIFSDSTHVVGFLFFKYEANIYFIKWNTLYIIFYMHKACCGIFKNKYVHIIVSENTLEIWNFPISRL